MFGSSAINPHMPAILPNVATVKDHRDTGPLILPKLAREKDELVSVHIAASSQAIPKAAISKAQVSPILS